MNDACFDKVRDAVTKSLDGLRKRQKALAMQNLVYLEKAIRAANEFKTGSLALHEAVREYEKFKGVSANGTYLEYTTAIRRSPELGKAVADASQKALDWRIQELRGQIEQRKAKLRSEIQKAESRLHAAETEYGHQMAPAFFILIGIWFIVVGILFCFAKDGALIGISLGIVGIPILILGLVSASADSRISATVSTLQSEVASLRSNLEREMDAEIAKLTEGIRAAESGKRAFASLKPTQVLQA